MNFLNLPKWDIINSQEDDERYVVLVQPLTGYTACPACGSTALVRNGRDTQHLHDLPAQGKQVVIQVQRQRYLCRDCRTSCSQPLPDVDERRNMTRRLVEYIQRKSISTRRTFVSIAEEVGLDPRSIRNVFNEYIDQLDAARCLETPGILGIDELHVLGAPRAIFTNLEANTIIELLDNRRKSSVIQYLRQLKSPERIHTVVSDLWQPYREAVQMVLPEANAGGRQVPCAEIGDNGAGAAAQGDSRSLTETQRKTLKMHNRYLLLRRKHDLKPEELFVLESWIKSIPLLGQGYELKERFFAIYDQPTREKAEAAYFAWIDAIPAELYPTYTPLMLTIEEWGDAIFAHFDHDRITGAFVEGANGLARVLSRMGRGYGLKALRGRLLYGLREGRGRKQVPTKESRNGDGVDGPFLGVPLSTLLPQDLSGNGDAPSTLESR